MLRSYNARSQHVLIEELVDVLAIHLAIDSANRLLVRPSEFGQLATSPARTDALAMSPEEVEAFERARWFFVWPYEATTRAANEGLLLPGITAYGVPLRKHNGRMVVGTNRLVVKLGRSAPVEKVEDVLKAHGLMPVRRLGFSTNLFEVMLPGPSRPRTITEEQRTVAVITIRTALDKLDELEANPMVERCEPVLIEVIPGRSGLVDPGLTRQWQWVNTRTVEAWNRSTGQGVRIAVIDNGFDPQHEDLKNAVGEESAYFDADEIFRRILDRFPDSEHGTFCAGIAAARQNNGIGGCGAAPEAELTLVACLLDQVGTQLTLARAVAYGVNPALEDPLLPPSRGADIICCSLGPNGPDWDLTPTLEEAIVYAMEQGRNGKGAIVIWASSNSYHPISLDEVSSYPLVLSVGRTTKDDRADGSAYGPELDLVAPGVDVFSTISNDRYRTWTGTSFAAPCVAGIAALVLGVQPSLDARELREILLQSCDKIGDGYDSVGHSDIYGYGRINAARAVARASGGGVMTEISISGPPSFPRQGPQFRISISEGRFFAVELATDPKLFHGALYGASRNDTNFFATWQVEPELLSGTTYQLPHDVWHRLNHADKIYYRIWISENRAQWINPITSTPDERWMEARSIEITDAVF